MIHDFCQNGNDEFCYIAVSICLQLLSICLSSVVSTLFIADAPKYKENLLSYQLHYCNVAGSMYDVLLAHNCNTCTCNSGFMDFIVFMKSVYISLVSSYV